MCMSVICYPGECDDLGCSQICVPDPLTGPRCICGEGYNMTEDGKTCLSESYYTGSITLLIYIFVKNNNNIFFLIIKNIYI